MSRDVITVTCPCLHVIIVPGVNVLHTPYYRTVSIKPVAYCLTSANFGIDNQRKLASTSWHWLGLHLFLLFPCYVNDFKYQYIC